MILRSASQSESQNRRQGNRQPIWVGMVMTGLILTATTGVTQPTAANSNTVQEWWQSVSNTDAAVQVYDHCREHQGGHRPPIYCECVANSVDNELKKGPTVLIGRVYPTALNRCRDDGTYSCGRDKSCHPDQNKSPAAALNSPMVSDTIAASPAAAPTSPVVSDTGAASQVAASQTSPSNPDSSINDPSPSAGGQTAEPDSSSLFYPIQNLEYLANTAGEYSAWADACNDPAGVAAKRDFLSMLNRLAPNEKAKVIQRFEKRYAQRKDYAQQSVQQCKANGRTDCCDPVKGGINQAKGRYQSSLKATVAAASSTPVPLHVWDRFSKYAGRHAAWADACGDPVGVTVKSDFFSKADALAPGEKAGVILNFETGYAYAKERAEKFMKQCTAKGTSDCCTFEASTATRGGAKKMSDAKKHYQATLKKFPVTATAKESPDSSIANVAATPALPMVRESVAESPAAAQTLPSPSAPLPASSPIPATPHALDMLGSYASHYAGWAAACGEPVTVKQDYLAAANLLAAEYRDPRIKKFNLYYSGTFDHVMKAKDFFANPVSPSSGQLQDGAINPCNKADGDDYKKKYETALLTVQKNDAAAKSAAAEKTKVEAEWQSAANTPPQSSRIEKINKADLDPAALHRSSTLASWGVTDANILACTGARDTMIRYNVSVMIEVAKMPAHFKESLKENYSSLFTLYSKQPCGSTVGDSSKTAEQAYAKYLKYQNYVLRCSAIIKTTPKGQDYNCSQ